MTDRDETKWLEWRRQGITATDIADAANGTYGGEYGVVARKLGLVTVETNAAMERGHRWQERIADGVSVLTGQSVVGEETWCENGDDPRWRATVDGFLSPLDEATFDDVTGVVEIKTYGRDVRPNTDRWDDQMQWQMFVTGTSRALLAAARIDDNGDEGRGTFMSMYCREVEANPARQSWLVYLAERLWAHIQTGTLPDPDESTDLVDVKAVNLTVDSDAETVDLAELESDIRRYVALKNAVQESEKERDALDAKIRSAVGHATRGTAGTLVVSVGKPRRVMTEELEAQLLATHPEWAVTVLDKKAAKKADKDLYDAHTAAIGARVMTIKETAK